MDVRRAAGVLLLAGIVSGCGPGDGAEGTSAAEDERRGVASRLQSTYRGDYPIEVVCTTGMVGDLVRNVGGEHVRVVQLMRAGVDPHLYRAAPADISALRGTDVIFYSGLHLEGQLAEVLERMARRQPTFPVTAGIEEDRLLEVEDGFFDPHVWFDVSLWSEAAQYVGDVLAKFDPQHAEEYRGNTKSYRQELAELHAFCRSEIAAIPEDRRVLVTAHDAFHYFGRAYGMQVKAIQGISTEAEASVRQINELVDFIVAHEIPAVFVETSVNERAMQALIDACAARGHQVRQGGELFSDAMGPEGTPEGTYPGMVRHNVRTIAAALR